MTHRTDYEAAGGLAEIQRQPCSKLAPDRLSKKAGVQPEGGWRFFRPLLGVQKWARRRHAGKQKEKEPFRGGRPRRKRKKEMPLSPRGGSRSAADRRTGHEADSGPAKNFPGAFICSYFSGRLGEKPRGIEVCSMRSFFYKLSSAMARFMYGRNGTDQLNWAILILYLALWVVRTLVSALRIPYAAMIVDILMFLLAVILLWRTFSRNLPKRRAENQRFVNWWWPIKNRFAAARSRRAASSP